MRHSTIDTLEAMERKDSVRSRQHVQYDDQTKTDGTK